jgi:hypothetical protein
MWFESQEDQEIFLFSKNSDGIGESKPPVQLIPASISTEVKGPASEAVHSPPSSVKVMKKWRIASINHSAFLGCTRTSFPLRKNNT